MEFSFDWIADPTAWLGLATLIALEIVLGIDNLIFIAIVADRLPPGQRDRARVIGLALALFMRVALLFSISWMTSLTQPLFTVLGFALSGRDLILMAGGLFLLFKATTELHERLEGARGHRSGPSIHAGFWATVVQIVVLDAVFSIDSVVTAVGMVNELALMVSAVAVAIVVMMVASGPLMRFVSAHPTVVVLCLGFLLMIGFSLVLDGFHVHVPKGYLYVAIGFSVLIEALNQVAQRNRRRAVPARDLRARTADAVLRLLGAGRASEPMVEDDVAALAATIGRTAVFSPAEKEMVRSVFDLAERPVRSLMTPRREVAWLDVTAPPEQVRQRVLQTNRSRYPLARRTLDNLVGVARAQQVLRDVLEKRELGAKTCDGQPLIVHDRMNALQLLERFRRERNHFAVVVDEFGSVQGVVTPPDVLEVIAGVPPEPGDGPPVGGEKQADGTWLFDGATELRRVCEALAAAPPEDGAYASLAGYLLVEFGRLPQPGDTLERLGLRFEVASVEGQRIAKVRVGRNEDAEPERAKADG